MTNITTGATTAALVFQSTNFEVITRDDQPWLKAADLARALGYSRSDKITRLFDRNSAEFTDSMTAVVEAPTLGLSGNLVTQTRIFSLRGAHLLAMFARTAIAALFRKWVLDILDTQTHQPALPTTITPAQAQHLRELVQLVVETGKQGHGETWNRLHRKMKTNSYLSLRPDQFDAACEYLRGKFDGESIASLIQKHLPALPAPNKPENKQMSLDVKTLCAMIHGGLIDNRAFMEIAYAVNQHQFKLACSNTRRGYGQEVADKIKTGLTDADLHAITVAATMETWMRTAQPKQVAA